MAGVRCGGMAKDSGRLFGRLALWIDDVPREGPAQMACDEAMLDLADRAVMRVFRWSRPWVSAGYFVPMSIAASIRPDLPVCRRWTGGGIVVHGGDFTFSLAVPAGAAHWGSRPAESYRKIHLAVAAALARQGTKAALTEGGESAADECFAAPVAHDVVCRGRKVAGGAQRRTRRGLLHQGSIQGVAAGPDFARVLAGCLAAKVEDWSPPAAWEDSARKLAREKYDNPDFLRGHRTAKNFTAGRIA